MLGPYTASANRTIDFKGNRLFSPITDVTSVGLGTSEIEQRVTSIHNDEMWARISRINDRINMAVGQYFAALGALFMPVPLTTRMISSPGAVYGREAIDYTTDTCPVKLSWFDLPREAFLAESSQIYLELALLQSGVDHVYANYHSFRKEEADPTHLSEFHHVEYEGKVPQAKNVEIAYGLLRRIVSDIIKHNGDDLEFFIGQRKIQHLRDMFAGPLPIVSLAEALELLYEDTGDERYKEFTLKHFGSWEEVRLTEIVGGIIGVSEMPLLEVPFYHAVKDGSVPAVADNCDIIWPGYRETVGSGHRVRSVEELGVKAEIFNLPREDYAPYLQSRKFDDYESTSGFGMGWERLVQGLLEMPFIYSASLFPRIHTTLQP